MIGRVAVLAQLLAGAFGCAHGPPGGASMDLRVAKTEVEAAVLEFAPAKKDRGYLIERKAPAGEWATIAELGAGVDTFRDSGLRPGSSYAYRLVATTERETKILRGGDEAELFAVDLRGASRVKLIATDGGDGNGNDHAIWGSPALVKTDGTRVALTALKPAYFRVGWGEAGEPRTIGIGSRKYENSIWAHAWSEMVYELGGRYERFEAMVGIDEARGREGSVTFKSRTVTSRFSSEIAVATPALKDSPGKTAYYVDSTAGDDAGDGTSPETAWKSLERVNGMKFAPGDRILFKAGSRYAGQLRPHGSGKDGAPIVIDRYGGEEMPRIDAEGRFNVAVLLANVEYWRVKNLEVTNTGAERKPGRVGVRVSAQNCGVMRDIRLTGLFVHDVNGSNKKGGGAGYGIQWGNGGGEKASYFDGLTIENCRLLRCDRNGICGWGYADRGNWHPSLNVVIRGNLLEDIGGDGIVPVGTDGCLIERNVIRGGRMRAADPAAGIWPWACDNTLVQFNEVSGMKGTKDGQGFDSDWNCRNSIFQYNYSHDNEGGFMLVCNDGFAGKDYSVGNVGTIIRYNVSQNDGARIFQFAGPSKDTTVHNNVFYVREGIEIFGIFHNSWGGFADGARFYNNIFHSDGKMRHEHAESTNNFYSHNAFFGSHENVPADAAAVAKDPMLVKPGSGGEGLDSLAGYQLKDGSPCIGAGRPMPTNGARDFWGNPLPGPGKPLDIGAHQSGK